MASALGRHLGLEPWRPLTVSSQGQDEPVTSRGAVCCGEGNRQVKIGQRTNHDWRQALRRYLVVEVGVDAVRVLVDRDTLAANSNASTATTLMFSDYSRKPKALSFLFSRTGHLVTTGK